MFPQKSLQQVPATMSRNDPPMKYWVFTTNNPEEEDLPPNVWPDVEYVVWQHERGENGTPHLQGYLELLQKHDIGWVTARLTDRKAAHVEPCKASPEANIAYCEKADGASPPYNEKKPVDRIWRWG